MEKKNEVLKFLYSLKNTLMHMSIEALKDTQLSLVQNTIYTLLELDIESELKKTEVKKFLYAVKDAIMAMSIGSLKDYSFDAIQDSLCLLTGLDPIVEEDKHNVKYLTFILKEVIMSMSVDTLKDYQLEEMSAALAACAKSTQPNSFMAHIATADPSLQLSCTGEISVWVLAGGEPVKQATYTDLTNAIVSIEAPANSEIYIIGDVTNIKLSDGNIVAEWWKSISIENNVLDLLYMPKCTNLENLYIVAPALNSFRCNGCTSLRNLDLSTAPNVHDVYCDNCTSLDTLDLGKNFDITIFSCDNCTGLTTIKYPASEADASTAIADAITNATAADGTVDTDSAADYYSTIADAATAKGWTIGQL